MAQARVKGNRTALRVAEHRSRVDAQMVEQARQVRCKLRSRIRRRKSPTPPVTAQVRNDHAMSGCKMPDYRLEHLAGDHQPVHEQERRSRAVLREGQQL